MKADPIKFLTIRSATYTVRGMTIDERLEALTQSLELLGSLQRDTDQKITTLTEMQRDMQRDSDARFARLDGILSRFMVRTQEVIDRFDRGMEQTAKILASHEHRIDALEN
jgi:hypothetical protein